jgi:hypothetical protein
VTVASAAPRRHGYGATLWLRWKTLSGSYRRLVSRSRS